MKYNTPYKFAFSVSLLAASGFSSLAQGKDLVYVPLGTPCEVISTLKTGPFFVTNNGGMQTRAYRAWSDGANSLVNQGGGACSNPDATRIPVAIAATVTARSRGTFHSKGNLTAFAVGAAEPDSTESHLNFWNENITNTTIIPLTGQSAGKHFNLRARIFNPVIQPGSKELHVTASVLGYYYEQTVASSTPSAPNIITVSASNADFTSPAAALASIQDASATTPYQINIGPGIYPLTATLLMKPYICIQGAGQKATTLEWRGVAGSALKGANNSTLSQMTVKRVNNADVAVAIVNGGLDDSFHMHDLMATAIGNSGTIAINNVNSNPSIKRVTVSATGSSVNIAIDNVGTSNPTIVDSHLMASGSGIAHGNIGVQLTHVTQATIDSSLLTAEDAISLNGSGTAVVRFSVLEGAIDGGTAANLKCTFNVDPDNTELNSTCEL